MVRSLPIVKHWSFEQHFPVFTLLDRCLIEELFWTSLQYCTYAIYLTFYFMEILYVSWQKFLFFWFDNQTILRYWSIIFFLLLFSHYSSVEFSKYLKYLLMVCNIISKSFFSSWCMGNNIVNYNFFRRRNHRQLSAGEEPRKCDLCICVCKKSIIGLGTVLFYLIRSVNDTDGPVAIFIRIENLRECLHLIVW